MLSDNFRFFILDNVGVFCKQKISDSIFRSNLEEMTSYYHQQDNEWTVKVPAGRHGGWNFRFSLLKHVEDFRVNAQLGNPQEAPRPWGVSAGTTLIVHLLDYYSFTRDLIFFFEGEILILIKTKFLSAPDIYWKRYVSRDTY